jgi:hypothetical protein
MRISLQRLGRDLAANGFQLSYFDEVTLEVLFVKPFSRELFGRIQIGQGLERGGKAGDIVSAGVQCSIVPGRTFLKGMGEHRCLTEVATDPSRGSSKLTNDVEVQSWEARLGVIGPQQAESLCADRGPTVVSSTQIVRKIGLECLDACRSLAQDPRQLLAALESQAQSWQLDEYRRILGCPIQMLPNGRLYYEIAVLAIVMYSGELKGDSSWFIGINPDSATDRDLMILIQFMASILAGEPGWPVPYFSR